jgi:hypothetical protein
LAAMPIRSAGILLAAPQPVHRMITLLESFMGPHTVN